LNEAHAVIAGSLVGFLPSPSTNVLHLGPLTLHMYGLMLLAGIAAALWLTRRRWTQMGGDGDLVYRVGLWGVAAGIVGARLYHVVTSWSLVPDPKWEGVFEVWNGGLGIWGGVLFGCAAGALVVRRAGASVRWMLDAAAPGLLLAQGRPLGQLVEPGAVREADAVAVGARDQPRAPACWVPKLGARHEKSAIYRQDVSFWPHRRQLWQPAARGARRAGRAQP
jgi:hypothetical protein